MAVYIPEVIELFTQNYYSDEELDFSQACSEGDVEKLRSIFKKNPNTLCDSLAVEAACQRNQVEVIRYLISECGMNINREGKTAIIIASYYGHTELVNMLIALGADVSVNDYAAVMSACRNGHRDTVKILLNHSGCVLPNINDFLMAASLSRDFEIIKIFLNLGCDPHYLGDTIVRFSCEIGEVRVLEYLKTMGVTFTPIMGQLLCVACRYDHLEVIKFLLDNGVDVHENRNSPILMCLKYDKKMSLECLINHIKSKEDFPLIEILNYAKILKKNGICNPSACISYLRDILSVYDDEFPADLIVDNDNCPVCDEAYQLFLPCRHVICKRCYYHLVDKKCPICRYVIDENLIKRRIL